MDQENTRADHGGFTLNLAGHLLSWQDETAVLVFDGEGRLYSVYEGDCLYRRGLDSSVLCTRRCAGDGRLIRSHRRLSDEETLALFSRAHARARALRARIERDDAPLFEGYPKSALIARLDAILGYTPRRLRHERDRFDRLYKPVSVLPPDQYMALVVQLTNGCPYNRCTFCDLYQDRDFEIKEPAELGQWLANLKRFMGLTLSLRKGVFLGDANCLSLPYRLLAALIERVNLELKESPVLDRGIFSFADVRAVLRKSAEDLHHLAKLGLRRVYVGLETGSELLLRYLDKPSSHLEQREAVKRLKSANLQVGVIFMSGIGGPAWAEEHVTETVKLTSELPLEKGDLIYLSRFYPIEGTPYGEQVKAGRIGLLSEAQITEQSARIRASVPAILKRGVKLAPYDLAGFIY
jgi:radical SAM superfamily enzyme YgiQ (UPF0313 family)